MTNKPMLSDERKLLVRLCNLNAVEWEDIEPEMKELRALLDQPAKPIPECVGDLERFEADDGVFVRLGDVIDMLGNEPAAPHQGEIDITPGRLAHAENVIEQQNSVISSLRVELVESYRIDSKHQGEPVRWERMSKMDGGTWWPCANKGEADDAVKCGWKVRPLFAEQPVPVAVALPFAEKVIAKLQRFEACASDGQDVDIGRHWFDLLTQLELLRRVQRSPAYWEMTQQGEDALKATRLNSPQ